MSKRQLEKGRNRVGSDREKAKPVRLKDGISWIRDSQKQRELNGQRIKKERLLKYIVYIKRNIRGIKNVSRKNKQAIPVFPRKKSREQNHQVER